ncbi:MAG: RluA family pseudouridine synthase [Lachnospiraceae bacterium]|nr:RluA family pseudouridine synthase [Lachnospiraceae bacterium]
MKQITVTNDMASQRLDKYLLRLLPACPKSLLYKQLRKKNITLNSSKATGSEIVKAGDVISVFFSDETYEKFASGEEVNTGVFEKAYETLKGIEPVYGDDRIIVFNKPAGILSQSVERSDLSVNEYLVGYLLAKGTVSKESLQHFRPSVCNRLDRNTSGLILCSKTLEGSRYLSDKIHEKDLEKYYLALVSGNFSGPDIDIKYVIKNEKENRLEFVSQDTPGAMMIKTGFEAVKCSDRVSLVKVRLYTGKSHQIRAHLSHLGFPILGDRKYGNESSISQAKRQMLHSYRTVLEEGIDLTAPVPGDMKRIIDKNLGSLEEIL